MLCEGVGVDQKVVEVDDKEFVQEIAEGVVHIVLEGTRRIAQAERHHRIFEQPVATSERCLPLLACCDSKPVIPIPDVHLGEVPGAADSVEQLPYKWQGVPVLLRDLVQAAIIHTKAKAAVGLLDK